MALKPSSTDSTVGRNSSKSCACDVVGPNTLSNVKRFGSSFAGVRHGVNALRVLGVAQLQAKQRRAHQPAVRNTTRCLSDNVPAGTHPASFVRGVFNTAAHDAARRPGVRGASTPERCGVVDAMAAAAAAAAAVPVAQLSAAGIALGSGGHTVTDTPSASASQRDTRPSSTSSAVSGLIRSITLMRSMPPHQQDLNLLSQRLLSHALAVRLVLGEVAVEEGYFSLRTCRQHTHSFIA